MKRTLSLRREALTSLSPDELSSVAAGHEHTWPQLECVVEEVTRIAGIVTDFGIALTTKCA